MINKISMRSADGHQFAGGVMLWKRIVAFLVVPLVGVGAFLAISAPKPPNIPLINLSSEPLFSKSSVGKPTLTLALSVEFPTVGAQYTSGDNIDDTYSPATEYVGYFDANSCYIYEDNPDSNLRRFNRNGSANGHKCGGAGFSGNFMNWAASSAVDVLRLGLTGGDRIVDTANLTILQRAVLRRDDFYNDKNFPAKQLKANFSADAVPTALLGTHSTDVWISNCLNRIHFGTDREGNCNDPGRNSNLGVIFTRKSGETTLALPNGTTVCAAENGSCNFSGIKRVYYGKGSKWVAVSAYNGIGCNNSEFTDIAPGVAKECRIGTDTTGWSPTGATGSAVLSSDRFFYARVQVCEQNAGVVTQPRPNYCLRYPSGNYKPVGNLQKFSENIRVAAFGYLKDDDRSRYGGVLRAKMKYVGPKNYDSNGVLQNTTNSNLEWNELTGVFVPNPDNAAEGKSGIINYLNQFGRTGAVTGVYKTNDPVAEMYYEALRYIQGLPPTPQAISGINNELKDGFQVYSSWEDPHKGGDTERDYACLSNNIVLIGDVNTHVDKSIPGYGGSSGDFSRGVDLSKNMPDFIEWTRVVGEFEAGRAVSYIDGKGIAQTTRNPNSDSLADEFRKRDRGNLAEARVSDDAAYFIAGMAYWARTHDIRGKNWTANPGMQRPGMRAKTFVLDVNEFGDQNDKDRRRNNQFFLASKYGGFADASEIGNPYLNKDGNLDNSNWASGGENAGEAQTYFLSSSATSVLEALDNIFIDIASQANSIAGGAAANSSIAAGGTDFFVGKFNPENWSGDLLRYGINFDSVDVSLTEPSGIDQSAAQQLDALTNAQVLANTRQRKIYIGKAARPFSGDAATDFEWNSIESGSGSVKEALNREASISVIDNRGEKRLNFLRGDRSDEGGIFRRRGSRMGDVINSGAVYSGKPSANNSDDDYRNFFNANKGRPATVFIGANDGMLHAFDAKNMKEFFAYIPSWVGKNLSKLTSPTYNSSHTSYVDATPAIAEAKVGGNWKTVLVSGTGAGGQGVFALDVSQPNAFNASKVMWEFTDNEASGAGDADLGNVIGKPQILKFKMPQGNPGAAATYKWFAVVASGVNNYQNDENFSDTGSPALFLLDLAKSPSAKWVLGQNYHKVVFPVTSDAATGTNKLGTGMVNFSATFGNAGEVDKIYAGDLHGNLWRLTFSLDLDNVSKWTLNNLSEFKNGATAVPFYIAKDGTTPGKVQPISMAPFVTFGPNGSSLISFGTGKYLEVADNVVSSNTQKQSVYTLFDDNETTTLDTANSAIKGRGRLSEGEATSAGISVPSFSWGRPKSDNPGNDERAGWYFDFFLGGSKAGERQITDFESFGSTLVFNSLVPPNAAESACGGGTGSQYTINLATGMGSSKTSKFGILAKPNIFEVTDENTAYSTSDSLGRRIKTVKGTPVSVGTGGVDTGNEIVHTLVTGRLSWRQINNYQYLKAAP